jgi:hypothetical protein
MALVKDATDQVLLSIFCLKEWRGETYRSMIGLIVMPAGREHLVQGAATPGSTTNSETAGPLSTPFSECPDSALADNYTPEAGTDSSKN